MKEAAKDLIEGILAGVWMVGGILLQADTFDKVLIMLGVLDPLFKFGYFILGAVAIGVKIWKDVAAIRRDKRNDKR